jgi:hypothetical protein
MTRTHAGAAVLQIKSIGAGGTTYTKTNIFTTQFRFSGGAIVSYLLVDGIGGNVLASDVLSQYGGFIKADELEENLNKKR